MITSRNIGLPLSNQRASHLVKSPLHRLHLPRYLSLVLLSLILLAKNPAGSNLAWAQSAGDALPELGDAATQYLNPEQEAHIGKQFLQQLLSSPNYIDDPEIQHYLNTLGRSIGKNASMRGVVLHVNLLENSELNAFAVPGGYITFHSGLILATDTESELASVVGHEIAHLSQRHLPRLLAKANAQKVPLILATIGSILIGGQAGVAGVTVANASAISNQLAYSRDFEREADAIGMEIMVEGGFDPRGMGQFFSKLQRFNAITSNNVPEFLRSHPLSYTRIAESESRLNNYPKRPHQSSFAYFLVKAKIRALYAGRPEAAVETLAAAMDESADSSTDRLVKDVSAYGLALAKSRLREFDDAVRLLIPLAEKYPDQAAIKIAIAEVYGQWGNHGEAIARYRALTEENPEAVYIQRYYLDALLAGNEAAEAKRVARYLLRRHPDAFQLYRPLSRANVALGHLAEAHQADGEYLASIGKYESAIASLRLALRDNADNSSYLNQSIDARIKELERAVSRVRNTKLPG